MLGTQNVLHGVSMAVGVMEKALYSSYTYFYFWIILDAALMYALVALCNGLFIPVGDGSTCSDPAGLAGLTCGSDSLGWLVGAALAEIPQQQFSTIVAPTNPTYFPAYCYAPEKLL